MFKNGGLTCPDSTVEGRYRYIDDVIKIP